MKSEKSEGSLMGSIGGIDYLSKSIGMDIE
jgi:hypothetical protein